MKITVLFPSTTEPPKIVSIDYGVESKPFGETIEIDTTKQVGVDTKIAELEAVIKDQEKERQSTEAFWKEKLDQEQARTLRYKKLLYSHTEQGKRIRELEDKVNELLRLHNSKKASE